MSAGQPPGGRYSLAGVRQADDGPLRDLLRRISQVIAADARVVAMWLVGSMATGEGDAFSDLDLQCLAADEAIDALRTGWLDLLHRATPTVWVGPFGKAIGGSCITPEWLHVDISFAPRSSWRPGAVVGMSPVLDKAGLLPAEPVPRPPRRGAPFFPAAAVEWFFYMLGSSVAVIGRGEMIPATNGVLVTRDTALVRLLLAEQGLAGTREHDVPTNPFPFTKRLRPYLTEEQHALLEALPPIGCDPDAVIDGYVALARVFIPRARRLAEQTGAEWPGEFERATVRFFEDATGATIGV
jgi:hypothetical protein